MIVIPSMKTWVQNKNRCGTALLTFVVYLCPSNTMYKSSRKIAITALKITYIFHQTQLTKKPAALTVLKMQTTQFFSKTAV